MTAPKPLSAHSPIVTVAAPYHTIPPTPRPVHGNPFNTMAALQSWETIVDERIALAHACQKSDSAESLEKLLVSPALDSAVQNGGVSDGDGVKVDICALHKETVEAGRKAYDAFHGAVESLKKEKPKEDWEDKIGAGGLVAKDAMVTALDTFAADAKAMIRVLADEEERVESAKYFSYCVNGYVLFVRKVQEALELVYEARKGGQQRVWTALETAGRTVHDAEVAALKWVAGQNAFASAGMSSHA